MLIKICSKQNSSKSVSVKVSGSFPVQDGQKQGVALSPLLLHFVLGYSISNVQGNKMGFGTEWGTSMIMILGENKYR
jgi:hypothetical protein